MDWTVYRFMLPACVVIATTAIFSGAALLTPLFMIGVALTGVPRATGRSARHVPVSRNRRVREGRLPAHVLFVLFFVGTGITSRVTSTTLSARFASCLVHLTCLLPPPTIEECVAVC
jgi:hypothetical protein